MTKFYGSACTASFDKELIDNDRRKKYYSASWQQYCQRADSGSLQMACK
jgi:hypothetical protein